MTMTEIIEALKEIAGRRGVVFVTSRPAIPNASPPEIYVPLLTLQALDGAADLDALVVAQLKNRAG